MIQDIALVVTDQQMDFQPGGALAVPEGDEIVEPIASLMHQFSAVVMTQDSHPSGHISFASSYFGRKPYDVVTLEDVEAGRVESRFPRETLRRYLISVPDRQQVLWPDHCIPGAQGWEFDPRIPAERASLILRKGTRLECDSYSTFRENDGTPTGLSGYLKTRGIKRIAIVGLAGDYCVYWSAKDARNEGFEVIYLESLTRFIGIPEGSRDLALERMKEAGVEIRSTF